MQKILLATHGQLASGLLSTLKIVAGDVSRVQAIDGYTGAEDITSAIENTLDSLRESDQLIVFTDLFGGSVNQLVTKLVMEKNIPAIIVSGFNVALVLAVLLANKPINKQQMQLYIDEARKGMTMVEFKSTQSNDSENDFWK